ncbi:3,5-bisphosphate nucleotidase [Gigaspora margarita]|uniref:3,5-bisphosphate nucleotidase n=1 Tax=Gigaspora margarita TaxID=4874 RepID=A0A8H4ABS7_GIGMA|nr:3,5-bisphosphate nucleotidase [Gigaspora margarita]
MWTIDLVDGTKCCKKSNLPVDYKAPKDEKGCLFIAVNGQGAFQRKFSSIEETQIHVADILSHQSFIL